MKKNKEEKVQNKKKTLDDIEVELDTAIKRKKRKKNGLMIVAIIIIAIIVGAIAAYDHLYGNKGYIRADIKISSSSKLYENSEPENEEDLGEGALFILYIDGIKRDDFLAEYEVTEITINEEKVNLENVTYRHLNKALSIRMHSENYKLEEGNVVIISLREKSSGQIITKRLYHTTEVI